MSSTAVSVAADVFRHPSVSFSGGSGVIVAAVQYVPEWMQSFNTADIKGLHQDCLGPYICLCVTIKF